MRTHVFAVARGPRVQVPDALLYSAKPLGSDS
jgi:hypothetical protein